MPQIVLTAKFLYIRYKKCLPIHHSNCNSSDPKNRYYSQVNNFSSELKYEYINLDLFKHIYVNICSPQPTLKRNILSQIIKSF